jgi:hypothetical protein
MFASICSDECVELGEWNGDTFHSLSFTYRRQTFPPTKSPLMFTSPPLSLLSFLTGRPLTMVTELPPVKLPPTLIMPPINAPPPVLMMVRGAGFGACSVLQYSQVLDFVGAPQFGQFMIFSFGLCPIAAWRLKLRVVVVV